MKKFLFLHYGFEKPTPKIMEDWDRWFEAIANRTVDRGAHFTRGLEIYHGGTRDLPLGESSITGYTIIEAESLDEAQRIAAENPFISSIRVYELKTE